MIDAEGNAVSSQLIPVTEADLKLRDKYVNLHEGVSAGAAPKFYLVFAAAIPPLGYTSFVVQPASSSSSKLLSITFSGKSYDSPVIFWAHLDMKSEHMFSSFVYLIIGIWFRCL